MLLVLASSFSGYKKSEKKIFFNDESRQNNLNLQITLREI